MCYDVELVFPLGLDGGLVADLVLALSSSLYTAACSSTCDLGCKFAFQ